MQQYNQFLRNTGCALALMVGVAGSAHAQSGSLGVGATGITGGGGFGMNANAWVPFMGFGAYLEGGFQDGNPYGDVGLGGRFMVGGNIGLGGLVSFAMQKGDGSDKMFYAIKPTFEVGFGGLTFSSTLQIPVGKKERNVKNSGSGQGELRDQPGNTNCSAPMDTNARVCDLWLVGREKSTEQNRFGVNFNAQYELNLGSFSITPNAGVYVHDRQGKNLVGLQGGVKVGFGFGNGLAIEAGINVRRDNKSNQYDDNHRTQAVFTAGLTWHFGGDLAGASESFVNRAPVRTVFDRGIRTQEKRGNSFEERARLQDSTSTVAVDRVEFVDSTVGNPTVKIDNLAANRVIIVQGNIILNNTTVTMNTNTAVIGGGSNVAIVGVTSGRQGTFLTPGARGVVTQTNNVTAVFSADNRNNVIFQGLDIQSNGNADRGIRFTNNSDNGRVRDVFINNVDNSGIQSDNGSDGTQIFKVHISQSGLTGDGVIDITNSQNARIEGVKIDRIVANSNGIFLDNADGAFITGADISDNNGNSSHGIIINNGTQDVTVQNSSISNVGGDGVRIDGANTGNIRLLNLQVTAGATTDHGINIINSADDVLLSNINIIGANVANMRGVRVLGGSQNIQFQNVHAQNWQIGFGLTNATSSVTDLGGNRFTAVGAQTACDGTNDVGGGINITTTNTGVVTLCR